MENNLQHIGTPRHSGRYPWGSGGNVQRSLSFISTVSELKKQGVKEADIATRFKLESTNDLRAKVSITSDHVTESNVGRALYYRRKGFSPTEIGKKMGVRESTIRGWLEPDRLQKATATKAIADRLADELKEKPYLDVGPGTASNLGVSDTKLKTALYLMKQHGYQVHKIGVRQLTRKDDKGLKLSVLTEPGVTRQEVKANLSNLSTIFNRRSLDGGLTFPEITPPVSVSGKRVEVKTKGEGGEERDGLIELRRTAPDLSLGNAKYAQVRILVEDKYFLKGMAIYSDSLPKNCDILFYSSKERGADKYSVMKPISEKDPSDPFDTKHTIVQKKYIGKDGKEYISPLNVISEEGSWDKWHNALASQVLSKQSLSTAKKQLALTKAIKEEELDKIMNFTNNTVKKKLLSSFADGCDSDAVHLDAAALPRQAWKVIIPFSSIADNEVYAPNFKNGEEVVLIRYPHGGRFEIPTLKVNNKNEEARRALGMSPVDAIGINSKVAKRLSGADFDGDTVLIIPNAKKAIATDKAQKELMDFDPRTSYPAVPGMKEIKTENQRNLHMGQISNLITDMQIRGAQLPEVVRAVKHSMVVIDSLKHSLNYDQSYRDNNIPELKAKYQGGRKKGASTLISKSTATVYVNTRTERRPNPETGERTYFYKNKQYTNKEGKVVYRKTKSLAGAETNDAFTLSSGTEMEKIYAEHANSLKSLANKARKELLATPSSKYDANANKIYSKQVKELEAAVALSEKNAPYERQAIALANASLKLIIQSNPDVYSSADSKNKLEAKELAKARTIVGAKMQRIDVSPEQWNAIQAGAVSSNVLEKIMKYAKPGVIEAYAMPRETSTISVAKINKAQSYMDAGYTMAEAAEAIGVSVSVLSSQIKAPSKN